MPLDYDTIGNVHYGFVGTGLGYRGSELTMAHRYQLPFGWGGKADPADIPAIRAGERLQRQYGGSLTKQQLAEGLVRNAAQAARVRIDPSARIENVTVP